MSRKCDFGEVNNVKLCIFRKPSEIGFFSLDGDREGARRFHDDNSQMKWIYNPACGWNGDLSPGLNWDLNQGHAQAIKKNFDLLEKGGPLLRWMLQHQEKIRRVFYSPKLNKLKLDFVFSRGLLTRIGSTLYDRRNEWSFCASKFKSVIYMVAFETDRQLHARRQDDTSERTKLMDCWGAKFEQYMTCDTPDSEPNTSVPVNEKEEFHIVLKGQLNGYTLLYNAEVDAKDSEHSQSYSNYNDDLKSTNCYIELKTNKNTNYFRKKIQKWWLQSFIGGIPKIICGHRDDEGIVQRLETFYVQDLPEMAKGEWNNEMCLKFCCLILNFVKRCVYEDNPEVVYKFMYELNSTRVTCEKLSSPGKHKILQEWFTSEFHI